jgi:hypothetical protein
MVECGHFLPQQLNRQTEERTMNKPTPTGETPAVTPGDLQRLLGDLDASTVVAIMALVPSMADIEEAALWVQGDGERELEPHQPSGTVEAILDLVAADDDDERRAR